MDKEKKTSDFSGWAIGLCFGAAIGLSLSILNENYAIWLPVGLAIGLCFGAAFSKKKKNENNVCCPTPSWLR